MKELSASNEKTPHQSPTTSFPVLGKSQDVLFFQGENKIFAGGDSTNRAFLVSKGKVQLSLLSESEKTPTLGVLSEDDFFGGAIS